MTHTVYDLSKGKFTAYFSSWKKTEESAIVPPVLFGQKLTRKVGTYGLKFTNEENICMI